jgi:hypothetical protein
LIRLLLFKFKIGDREILLNDVKFLDFARPAIKEYLVVTLGLQPI